MYFLTMVMKVLWLPNAAANVAFSRSEADSRADVEETPPAVN